MALVTSLGIVSVAALVVGERVVRAIRSVNEPDPARFPVANVRRMLRSGGVDARIDRVLYVDLDSNGVIFVGRIGRLDPAMLTPIVSGEARYLPGSRRYGAVTVVVLGSGRELIAVVAATTRSEVLQSATRFRARVDELVRSERGR